ncbi:TraR/DksA C4-type zinc finger protein [Paenibacillus polymyxa]|uniref:TraR/DksA C4-type zinc finger protein n=1 Tax=Paenibacillus polymyxa TaxID=1406 RepID=UPI002024117C|nr:TraR/DksA C4-type zinc finger protein [Paenibacillus polymyxa]URJ45822.1 TraR/DksA C4-type zinc finger protein [Paenibacillus polymyxa]
MNHLNDSQLAELKHMLLEQKKDLEKHFEQNGQDNAPLGETLTDSTGELSSYDNHPADIGTETFERSRDLAINDSLQNELEQVNAALQRMKEGTYGICVGSGEEIPFERLQAIPYTAYTIEHTPTRELSNDRPVEEQVMTPPPKGAGEVRQRNAGRFDDAGAWDAVEKYGTSNSPATAAKRDVTDYDENM